MLMVNEYVSHIYVFAINEEKIQKMIIILGCFILPIYAGVNKKVNNNDRVTGFSALQCLPFQMRICII